MSLMLVLAHGGEFRGSRMIVAGVIVTWVIVVVMLMSRVIVTSVVMI